MCRRVTRCRVTERAENGAAPARERRKTIYAVAGPAVFLALAVAPLGGLPYEIRCSLGLLIWMSLWWITRPVHLAVTGFPAAGNRGDLQLRADGTDPAGLRGGTGHPVAVGQRAHHLLDAVGARPAHRPGFADRCRHQHHAPDHGLVRHRHDPERLSAQHDCRRDDDSHRRGHAALHRHRGPVGEATWARRW